MFKKNFYNYFYIIFLGAISSYSLPPYNYFIIKNMKAVSIAVMALLGQVSAISLKNSAVQQSETLVVAEENRPDDTILL